jgi:nitrite reductase (NO-forming)
MQGASMKGLATWTLLVVVMGLLLFAIPLYSSLTHRSRTGTAGDQSRAAIGAASASAAPAAQSMPMTGTAGAPTSMSHGAPASSPARTAAAPYAAPARAPVAADAPPYNPADIVDVAFTMDDNQVIEVAPGTYYEAWTFNGQLPGPVIRVKQGATVNVTLVNQGRLPHSLDFHSARTPISNYRNVSPGESFAWSFVATVPGVYLYHCGTAPALQHIGNGMYGVMIVDPDPPLAAADHEYVLLQSEFYLGERQPNGVISGDFLKMQKIDPDIVAFNGHQSQYRDQPLTAEPGELVRLYVVDAGPTLNASFHVVGGIFDRVYANGNPAPENTHKGIQTAEVPVGGGTVFDVRPEEAGDYLFVSHAFAQASKGAVGVLRVGHLPDSMGQNIDH